MSYASKADAVRDAMTALQRGARGTRLPTDWEGSDGEIAVAFNAVAAQNERMADELSRLRPAIGDRGSPHSQFSIGEVAGFWEESAACVNDLLEALRCAPSSTTHVPAQPDPQSEFKKFEFLSILAHELRNPLAPICNAVQILKLDRSDPVRIAWARDVIERQVAHMARLVDDLLDIARITQGKIRLRPEPVLISQIIAQAVEASRPTIQARSHQFKMHLPAEPVTVTCDPTRMAQVLTSLLTNAAKYTPEGGTIALQAAVDGEQVVFRVCDSGIGIPQEMLSAIFELFTQIDRSIDRTESGLGIGLTLCKRLVELHGGSVEAQSAGPDCGSEFIVRLPLKAG